MYVTQLQLCRGHGSHLQQQSHLVKVLRVQWIWNFLHCPAMVLLPPAMHGIHHRFIVRSSGSMPREGLQGRALCAGLLVPGPALCIFGGRSRCCDRPPAGQQNAHKQNGRVTQLISVPG